MHKSEVKRIAVGQLIFFLLLTIVDAEVICPSNPEDYAPCNCYPNYGDGTIYLDCYQKQLSDLRTGEILNLFLTTPNISLVGRLDLSGNQLTRVPDQIGLFNRLDSVYVDNNKIDAISSEAFNFSRLLYLLDFQHNSVSRIESGAFQGEYGAGSRILLRNNTLSRFDSDVFQSVLEKMAPHDKSYVSIYENSIDCESDLCHLSWLIRDNRDLLNAVIGGTCSNGTIFAQLNMNGFDHC